MPRIPVRRVLNARVRLRLDNVLVEELTIQEIGVDTEVMVTSMRFAIERILTRVQVVIRPPREVLRDLRGVAHHVCLMAAHVQVGPGDADSGEVGDIFSTGGGCYLNRLLEIRDGHPENRHRLMNLAPDVEGRLTKHLTCGDVTVSPVGERLRKLGTRRGILDQLPKTRRYGVRNHPELMDRLEDVLRIALIVTSDALTEPRS